MNLSYFLCPECLTLDSRVSLCSKSGKKCRRCGKVAENVLTSEEVRQVIRSWHTKLR